MKKYLYILCAALSIFFAAGTGIAGAADESQAFIRGIRPLGMGGAFVAVADDQNAVFYNPAGLTQRQGNLFTLFELPINITNDMIDFYNFYKDNENDLKNFNNLSASRQADLINRINNNVVSLKAGLRTGLPNLSYLLSSRSLVWGAGLFNQEDIRFRFNRSIVPSVTLQGSADVIAAAPIAYRFSEVPYLPGSVSVGATMKYIARGKIEEIDKSVLALEDFSPQLQWGKGLGADLGAIYHYDQQWNFGLQVTDVGGTKISYDKVNAEQGNLEKPAYDGLIKTQWNVGTMYVPSKVYFWPGRYINTHDRLILAADVRDFASSDERVTDATFWKKLHMGGELRWGPMSLRGGFSSGYPAFGAGIRVPYLGLRADYAFWGDELGRYAGQIPEWNHQITVALSWGDASGKAYGSNVKVPVNEVTVPAAAPAALPDEPAPAVISEPAATQAPATEAPAPAPAEGDGKPTDSN